jgi:hypothetical protein
MEFDTFCVYKSADSAAIAPAEKYIRDVHFRRLYKFLGMSFYYEAISNRVLNFKQLPDIACLLVMLNVFYALKIKYKEFDLG